MIQGVYYVGAAVSLNAGKFHEELFRVLERIAREGTESVEVMVGNT